MTREEAIEVLQKNYPDSCYSMLREAVDMAIEALEYIEKHKDILELVNVFAELGFDTNKIIWKAQEWIPCSNGLLEMYDKELLGDYDNSRGVLVTIQDHGKTYVSECSIEYLSDYIQKYLDDEVHEIEDAVITAWMSLPEPYKAESEE